MSPTSYRTAPPRGVIDTIVRWFAGRPVGIAPRSALLCAFLPAVHLTIPELDRLGSVDRPALVEHRQHLRPAPDGLAVRRRPMEVGVQRESQQVPLPRPEQREHGLHGKVPLLPRIGCRRRRLTHDAPTDQRWKGTECSQSASSARSAVRRMSGWSSIMWWPARGSSTTGATLPRLS